MPAAPQKAPETIDAADSVPHWESVITDLEKRKAKTSAALENIIGKRDDFALEAATGSKTAQAALDDLTDHEARFLREIRDMDTALRRANKQLEAARQQKADFERLEAASRGEIIKEKLEKLNVAFEEKAVPLFAEMVQASIDLRREFLDTLQLGPDSQISSNWRIEQCILRALYPLGLSGLSLPWTDLKGHEPLAQIEARVLRIALNKLRNKLGETS